MEIAKKDGYGVDAAGIRRRIIAGQPIPPGIQVDKGLKSGDEIGHINPEVQGDHESERSAANQERVEAEQRFRSDVEGSKAARDDKPERKAANTSKQRANR